MDPKLAPYFPTKIASQPSLALLLTLPLEIRYHIFSFLISTPCIISIELSLKPKHTNAYISNSPTRGHLSSLSETCTQLRDEISIWTSTLVYPAYSITNLFGIIDPRIANFEIVFQNFMCVKDCHGFWECVVDEGDVWSYAAPADVGRVMTTLNILCWRGAVLSNWEEGSEMFWEMVKSEGGEGKEEVLR
jgi:hypothetical protein